MTKLGPQPAPKGPGKDGPKEINHDGDQVALAPITPRISPQPKTEYLHNKVTKYVNGSKIEFNTTEGHEYINIQHGNELTRMTFFEDGNIEIIQQGGERLDEVSKDFATEVGGKHSIEAKTRTSKQKNYNSKSGAKSYFSAGTVIVLESKKIILRGNVEITGDLIVRGNIKGDGDLVIRGEMTVDGIPGRENPNFVEPSDENDAPDNFESDQVGPAGGPVPEAVGIRDLYFERVVPGSLSSRFFSTGIVSPVGGPVPEDSSDEN